MNAYADNGYDPKTRTINWDPTIGIMAGDDKVITPALILGHELGHAFLQDISVGPIKPLMLEDENRNIAINENPIARQLGLGVRSDYYDWQYTFNADGINSKDIPSYNKTRSFNIIYLERLLNGE
jgi:hypothetical protein